MASTFTPIEGMVQLWITSAAVTSSRVSVIVGMINRLSTSRRRGCIGLRSSSEVIYESNSKLLKSEYS